MPIGAEVVEPKKKKKSGAKDNSTQSVQGAQNRPPQGKKQQASQNQQNPPQRAKEQQKPPTTAAKEVKLEIPVPSFADSFTKAKSKKGSRSQGSQEDEQSSTPQQFRISHSFVSGSEGTRAFPARGVTNPANLCYAASVMQSMIHCPPIAHFCATVANPAVPKEIKQGQAPVAALLGGWMSFYWKGMSAPTSASRSNNGSGGGNNRATTTPIAAPKLGNLKALKIEGNSIDGRSQQDAHELIVSLLDALQQEAAALAWDGGEDVNRKQQEKSEEVVQDEFEGQASSDDDDDGGRKSKKGKKGGAEKGWTVVGQGKKEKLSVRTHHDQGVEASEASAGPGRFFKSVITGAMSQHFKGSKGTKKGHTSVVIQPFLAVLPVDIGLKPKQTLEEAISFLSVKEVIENSTEGGKEIKKVTFLSSLPDVLIIMLQRYAWTAEGERVKLDNVVDFSSVLTVPQDVVDPTLGKETLGKAKERTFGLQSVICHRGETPNSGHYVTYTPDFPITKLPKGGKVPRHDGTFTVFNDSRVGSATWKELNAETPYLLWYQRLQ